MDHEAYMRRALELAAQAGEEGDVPVGCVIVRDGAIVGEGRNRREENGDATAHAELEAAPVHYVCHPGALPHVCRRDHQRPGGYGALWDPGRQGGGLRLGAQPV